MKTVIFSDLHSNLFALEELIRIEGKNAQYICVGDLIGYMPFNNECIELFTSLDYVWIRGNHEQMFLNQKYDEHCTSIAKTFFTSSYNWYDRKYDDSLNETLPSFRLGEYLCQHTISDKYLYPNTHYDDLKVEGKYIIGHSHIAFHKTLKNLEIFNTGSLGQNRKNLARGEYLLYENFTFSFRSIDIPIQKVIDALVEHDYKEESINYYKKLSMIEI